MKKANWNLLVNVALLTFFILQNCFAQDDAINTGIMYVTAGTIVSDEGSFTTSAAGSTENNGDFYLKGDWVNNGSYPAGTGKVIFWGNASANISGTAGTTFYNAEVNKSSNGVTVNINTEVSNILTLTSGPVDLNTNRIVISNSATAGIGFSSGYLISEQTDNSSILQWNMGSTTGSHIIPFGKIDGTSIPLTLNLTAGTIGNVTTSTYPSAADNTPYPVAPDAVANMNGPSGDNSANVVDRFWQIDKTGASGTLTVTFTYSDSEAPANGETDLVAQRYSSGWEVPVPFQSSDEALNTVTTPGVTVFGPYTLSQSASPLPLQLLSFETIFTKTKQVDIKWKTASETNNNYFTVERSKDFSNSETIAIVNGVGNSTVVNEYYTMDKNPFNGISYYRLKQTDMDGNYSLTNWRTINNYNEGMFNLISAQANPAANEFKVVFSVPENGDTKLYVSNTIGEIIFSKNISSKKGINSFSFPVNNRFSNGIYNLNAIYSDEMMSTKLMWNQ